MAERGSDQKRRHCWRGSQMAGSRMAGSLMERDLMKGETLLAGSHQGMSRWALTALPSNPAPTIEAGPSQTPIQYCAANPLAHPPVIGPLPGHERSSWPGPPPNTVPPPTPHAHPPVIGPLPPWKICLALTSAVRRSSKYVLRASSSSASRCRISSALRASLRAWAGG